MARGENWDIFCTVVDNFGDIGVAWRLTRQLVNQHQRKVTLWVDDLESFARIEPRLDPMLAQQQVAGANIRKWSREIPDVEPADVVLEAFACKLPASYLQRMAGASLKPVWINLEYLCAEPWVEGAHALPSPHLQLPLTKHFFFPGFTNATGGLLRESDLLARRDAFLQDAAAQTRFWQSIGVPPDTGDDLRVSLFCYRNEALPSLLQAWVTGASAITCLMPEGPALEQVHAWFGSQGTHFHRGNLTLRVLPFMAQDDYDKLLWACDVNFVRGEDSFLRAQWAGKPFVWHIYPQDEDAHWPKLEAFLDIYSANLGIELTARLKFLVHHWNRGQDTIGPWRGLAAGRDGLEIHARAWAGQLASKADLAKQLAEFADKLL